MLLEADTEHTRTCCTHMFLHIARAHSARLHAPEHTRIAQVCEKGLLHAHVVDLHLAFSILMFHSPSLLFPDGHFETTFPTLTSTTFLPSFPVLKAQDKRTPARAPRSLAIWPSPVLSTGNEPKQPDKTTSVDGDTTPFKDPDHDSISDFSKTTRESTGLFGVSTVFEASASHVSCGDFALQRESKASMPRKPLQDRERERERGKRRFCDQCCRVDVKEKSTEQY